MIRAERTWVTRSLVIKMSKASEVAEGLYGTVVGVRPVNQAGVLIGVSTRDPAPCRG